MLVANMTILSLNKSQNLNGRPQYFEFEFFNFTFKENV